MIPLLPGLPAGPAVSLPDPARGAGGEAHSGEAAGADTGSAFALLLGAALPPPSPSATPFGALPTAANPAKTRTLPGEDEDSGLPALADPNAGAGLLSGVSTLLAPLLPPEPAAPLAPTPGAASAPVPISGTILPPSGKALPDGARLPGPAAPASATPLPVLTGDETEAPRSASLPAGSAPDPSAPMVPASLSPAVAAPAASAPVAPGLSAALPGAPVPLPAAASGSATLPVALPDAGPVAPVLPASVVAPAAQPVAAARTSASVLALAGLPRGLAATGEAAASASAGLPPLAADPALGGSAGTDPLAAQPDAPGAETPPSPASAAAAPPAPAAPAAPALAMLAAAPVAADAPVSETRGDPAPAPQQEAAIEQVAALRDAARSQRPEMLLRHAEFGLVSLRLEAAGPQDWRAVLASRDPGFVPAIQAALAERAIAATADPHPSAGQHHGASSEQRYGSSPGSQQGSAQPYLEHQSRGEEGTSSRQRSAAGPGNGAAAEPDDETDAPRATRAGQGNGGLYA